MRIPGFDRYWAELVQPYLDTDAELRLILDTLCPLAGERLVDLGCGHGRFAPGLTALGVDYLGIDSCADLLGMVPAGKWIHGDCATNLDNYEAYFDYALSWFASFGFTTREDDAHLFAATCRALRPGGRFLIGTLNLLFPWGPGTTDKVTKDGTVVFERLHGLDVETSELRSDRFVLPRNEHGHYLSLYEKCHQILYSYRDLREALLAAGFSRVSPVRADIAAYQMVVLAEKA